MPMYNLTEHSSNYSEITGSLWFYSKDEATNFNADLADNVNFKSFKYKAKLLGNGQFKQKEFKQFLEITRNAIN